MKLLNKMKELSTKYKTILSYCLKFKKNTENINPVVWKTSYIKTILLSKCATCGSKKSRFIKEQKATGLDVKTPLSKILLSGDILI